jgi:hypothetical protein
LRRSSRSRRVTYEAIALAESVPGPYASVLKLLEDCHEVPEVAGPLYRQQHAGATYKSLATIGHRVQMDKAARTQWYRIAGTALARAQELGPNRVILRFAHPKSCGDPAGKLDCSGQCFVVSESIVMAKPERS